MSPLAQSLMQIAALHNRITRRLIVVVAFIGWVAAQQANTHAAPVRTVALTGQWAPGGAGATFQTFGTFVHPDNFIYGAPVLNDAGQVAFRADLAGEGIDFTNYQGIWSEGSGSMTLIARTGSQAPGAPTGVSFSTDLQLELFFPTLNNAGQTAFYGATDDGKLGLWSEGSGSLAAAAISGQPAPGASGATFDFSSLYEYLDTPVLNDAGQTWFRAYLADSGVTPTNNFGLWSDRTGSLELVARRGSAAPGLSAGVNHDGFYEAGINNAGQLAFHGVLTGTGVNSSNNQGIWSEGSGSLSMVVRSGSPAPGMPTGVTFGNILPTGAVNNHGQTAFVAGLSSETVQHDVDSLWLADSDGLTLLARRGTQAPSTPTGVSIDGFGTWPEINDSGQVTTAVYLTGQGIDASNNVAGYLFDASGNATLLFRKGDQAPGMPAGTVFDLIAIDTAVVLNSSGQVAALHSLAGPGVDFTNDRGIWASDRAGVQQLVVRKGDALEVAPGDIRTISELSFMGGNGNGYGWSTAFNNFGQIAFWASFTDGTEGVFVSNAVADFAWKNLTKVHFFDADMTGADLSGADARGAPGLNLTGVTANNLIRPNGHIDGLNLAAGEKLVAYPGVPIPVKISGDFSIAAGATFDITDNAGIVEYSGASPATTVRQQIITGRGGSGLGKPWNGAGITSSAAATANTAEPESRSIGYAENAAMPLGALATFHGQAVDDTSILLAYTRTGDANLDGVVNDDDVTIVSASYAPGIPQPSWALGDFDYNGFVDDDDVTLLGAFYDPSAAPLASPLAEAATSAAAVPEPGTFSLVGSALSAVWLLAFPFRRRRQGWHRRSQLTRVGNRPVFSG